MDDESKKHRVLVVDDNSDAADMLAIALDLCAIVAQAIYDGRAAVELADSFEPDVAILDLNMPAMDGYEVCRQLKRRLPLLCVLALTAEPPSPEKLREAGFAAQLQKPVDLAVLLETLNRLSAGASAPRR